MKKSLSWQILISLGVVLILISRFFDGVIPQAIGVLGDILFVVGVINLITTLIQRKKKDKGKEGQENINNNENIRELKTNKFNWLSIITFILLVGFLVFLLVGGNYFKNKLTNEGPEQSNILKNQNIDDWYQLEVPYLNFKIKFPQEPKLQRTDGDGFTRYFWSYIDEQQNMLSVSAQTNFYLFSKNQKAFIEEYALIYGGVINYLKEDSNTNATTYKISWTNESTNKIETIVGKIIDIGDLTVNITNSFSGNDKYPEFISTFELLN